MTPTSRRIFPTSQIMAETGTSNALTRNSLHRNEILEPAVGLEPTNLLITNCRRDRQIAKYSGNSALHTANGSHKRAVPRHLNDSRKAEL